MKMLKRIIVISIVLTIGVVGYGWYIYNKKPADVRSQSADLEIKAEDLFKAFQQDEPAANLQYVDKVMVVSGKVSRAEVSSAGLAIIYLGTGDPLLNIVCSFYETEAETVKKIASGSHVKVKGMCTGVLSDVILNKCSMAK